MVVLPQFLFVFQHVPIFIKKSFFVKLDSLINEFLWGNKQAHMRKSVLQLPKTKGGLALPNFRYYWAGNISKLLFWNTDKALGCQSLWATMEISISIRFLLWSVVCSKLPLPAKQISVNLVVISTLKIWNQFRRQFCLHRASGLAPISHNHLFLPSSDPVFQMWSEKGLRTIYDLPKPHLFCFLQILHFVRSQFPQFPNRPPVSMIDPFLLLNIRQRGLIMTIYNLIFKVNPNV